MFGYYKAKADPSEGVTKDTYRIWREKPKRKAQCNLQHTDEPIWIYWKIKHDNIKQWIENELTKQNKTDSVGDDVFVEKFNNLYEATYEDEVEPSCNPSEIEDQIKEIKCHSR